MPLLLGTRASALAQWQAQWVAARLGEQGHSVELVPIVTHGDRGQGDAIGEHRPDDAVEVRGVRPAVAQADDQLPVGLDAGQHPARFSQGGREVRPPVGGDRPHPIGDALGLVVALERHVDVGRGPTMMTRRNVGE